jgi:hypothetical protein
MRVSDVRESLLRKILKDQQARSQGVSTPEKFWHGKSLHALKNHLSARGPLNFKLLQEQVYDARRHINGIGFYTSHITLEDRRYRLRVTAPNYTVKPEKEDLLGLGLDMTEAMLHILKHTSALQLSERECLIAKIGRFLSKYIEDMEQEEDFKRLVLLEKTFVGELAHLLLETGLYNKHSEVCKCLFSMRNYLRAIHNRDEIVCTTKKDTHGNKWFNISIPKRMEALRSWNNYTEKGWFQSLHKRHGAWFSSFIHQHHATLSQCSIPADERRLPNPSNLYEDFCFVGHSDGRVTTLPKYINVAATSPFKFDSSQERYEAAEEAHEVICSPKTLVELVADRDEHLGVLGNGEVGGDIYIPILHQTLLDPKFFNIPGIKAELLIANKILRDKKNVNARLRAYFNKHEFYYNADTKTLNSRPISAYDKRVHFELYETNYCVNLWRYFSFSHHVREQQLRARRGMNALAINFLLRAEQYLPEADRKILEIVIKHLQASQYLKSAHLSAQDKKMLTAFCNRLCWRARKSSDHQWCAEVAKVIESAVAVKKLGFESLPAKSYRGLMHAIGLIPGLGTPLTFFMRVLMGVTILPLRHIFRVFTVIKQVVQKKPSRIISEAVHMLRLVEALGGLSFGGCKSSLDRALEVKSQKLLLESRFINSGVCLKRTPSTHAKLFTLFGAPENNIKEQSVKARVASGCPTIKNLATREACFRRLPSNVTLRFAMTDKNRKGGPIPKMKASRRTSVAPAG